MITLDVNDEEVLDLTGCGLDVNAVATDLAFAGNSCDHAASDERHPIKVLRRVSNDAIRPAGYRVIRIREWIDWGAGERHAESVYDCRCDRHRATVRCSRCLTATFNSPTITRRDSQERGSCVRSAKRREVMWQRSGENQITFRCEGCGYRWSAE